MFSLLRQDWIEKFHHLNVDFEKKNSNKSVCQMAISKVSQNVERIRLTHF